MAFPLSALLDILSIIGSFLAVHLSCEIYKTKKLPVQWLSVTWAFILVIIRRTISVLISNGAFPDLNDGLILLERCLLVLISFLYITGFYTLKKYLNSHIIIKWNGENIPAKKQKKQKTHLFFQ